MKKRTKFLCVALAIVMVMLTIVVFTAAKPTPEPYVDSWEAAQAMSEEELIAIGETILGCANGELPDHAFAVMVRLQDIDPELADACFQHIAEISTPAQKPAEREGLFRSDEPDRFGAYVRDGNGGYYEYEEYEDSE